MSDRKTESSKEKVREMLKKRGLSAKTISTTELMKLIAEDMGHKVDPATVEKTETKKIIIPQTMTKLDAAEELARQHEEEESIVNLNRDFNNWDYKDVLVAIKRAVVKHFGWLDAKTKHTFFGPVHPSFIQVTVDVKDGKDVIEEAFYGETAVSAWENAEFRIAVRNASTVTVSFELKKRYKDEAAEFFSVIEDELKNGSIYRAKSLVINSSSKGGVEYKIFENNPSDKIFLNEDADLVIQDFVEPELLEVGKRTFLFTGNFGTGKTETAMRLGKTGNDNKTTFIYLKDSELLENVILLAQNYSPAILFLEDLDEVASGDRTVDINHILNTLDGIESKRSDLKIIFTTNNENKINPAFRRPGRIDQIVKFENPTPETKKKIVSAYIKDFPGFADINLDEAVSHFPDAQGAVIAEISKRIARLAKKNGEVNASQFISASASIQPQLDLMKKDMEQAPPSLDTVMTNNVRNVVKEVVDSDMVKIKDRLGIS